MNLETEKLENIYTIRLKGSLDGSNSADFLHYIEECIRSGYRLYLFHLDRLDFITSGGISVLLRLQKYASEKRAFAALCGANPEVATLLEFLGITKKWKLFQDPLEAEKFLRSLPVLPRASTPQTKPNLSSIEPIQEEIPLKLPERTKTRPVRFYFQEGREEKSFSNSLKNDEPEAISSLERVEEEPIPSVEIKENWNVVLEEKIQAIRNEMEKDRQDIKSALISLAESDAKPKDTSTLYFTKPNPKSYARNLFTTPNFDETVYCESCHMKLKVYRPGLHKCPNCNAEFEYNRFKKIRYFEKL